jgi:hypothetical protein
VKTLEEAFEAPCPRQVEAVDRILEAVVVGVRRAARQGIGLEEPPKGGVIQPDAHLDEVQSAPSCEPLVVTQIPKVVGWSGRPNAEGVRRRVGGEGPGCVGGADDVPVGVGERIRRGDDAEQAGVLGEQAPRPVEVAGGEQAVQDALDVLSGRFKGLAEVCSTLPVGPTSLFTTVGVTALPSLVAVAWSLAS